MQTFLEGLEQLRATAVPLECVPPPFRNDAVEEAAEFAAAAPSGAPVPSSSTPTPSAPAGRKLHQYVDPLASSADDAAVAAAAAAAANAQAALRLENLKSLFLNLRVTEFGTAIFELVVFEQVEEDLNIQARRTRMAAVACRALTSSRFVRRLSCRTSSRTSSRRLRFRRLPASSST